MSLLVSLSLFRILVKDLQEEKGFDFSSLDLSFFLHLFFSRAPPDTTTMNQKSQEAK